MENQKNEYTNMLISAQNTFLDAAIKSLTQGGITLDEYQKQCAMAALTEMNRLLVNKGQSWSSIRERSGIISILQLAAANRLNAEAVPRECYIILRKTKVGNDYIDIFEFGVEGDGYDVMLREFGADVKTVHKYWSVREEDTFKYPKYNGLEIVPPIWEPTGKGKVIRVVYPITKIDGSVEYLIAEREDVKNNLIAQINNNLMNECFGIAKNRYVATEEQKKKIDEQKIKLKALIPGKTLDQILECEELRPWISLSYLEEHSREAMIERKMRNNVVKKYPKRFINAYAADLYNRASDEEYARAAKDLEQNANSKPPVDVVDVEYDEILDDEENFNLTNMENSRNEKLIDEIGTRKEKPGRKKVSAMQRELVVDDA